MGSFYVAVYALIERKEDYLLVKEGKPHVDGMWNLPGGGVEEDESLQEALRREVKEESNLEIEIIGLSTILRNRSSRDGTPVLNLVFEAEAEQKPPNPPEDREVRESEFKTLEEIKELEMRKTIFQKAVEHKNTAHLPLESIKRLI